MISKYQEEVKIKQLFWEH